MESVATELVDNTPYYVSIAGVAFSALVYVIVNWFSSRKSRREFETIVQKQRDMELKEKTVFQSTVRRLDVDVEVLKKTNEVHQNGMHKLGLLVAEINTKLDAFIEFRKHYE